MLAVLKLNHTQCSTTPFRKGGRGLLIVDLTTKKRKKETIEVMGGMEGGRSYKRGRKQLSSTCDVQSGPVKGVEKRIKGL